MRDLYIEDVNGIRYTFKKPHTFKENLAFFKIKDNAVKNADLGFESTVDTFKSLFLNSNPNYPEANFDNDIIEYNYRELGTEKLLKLINVVIEEVFMVKGANPSKYEFLEEE